MTAARLRVIDARLTRSANGAALPTRLEAGRGTETDISGGADLLVAQPLDVFGRARAARSQGDAAVVAAIATFRQSALDVQHEVLLAYANLGSAIRLLALAEGQRTIATEVRNATSRRVENRDVPALQLTRADLDLARAEGLVQDRAAAVAAARARFAAAIGAETTSADAVEPIALSEPTGLEMTKERPDLMTLRAEQAASEADARAADASRWPSLEIQAGRVTFTESESYGIRLQLTTSLWDHGAARNSIRAANARRDAAKASLVDRTRIATAEVQAASIDLAAAEKSIANYGYLSHGAQELLARTRRGFELGATTLLDVLDARRALSDAEELRIAAILRRDLAADELLSAQGRLMEEPA